MNVSLLEMVKNGLKAIKESSNGRITIRVANEGGKGLIEISDNGPGVPLSFQPFLFKPFSTSSQDDTGTGLGLAFCAMVVEDFDGEILYHDAVGGGAQFTISIPVADPEKHKARDQGILSSDVTALT